ncbi:unnamed protein product [Ophioblennius macclurei]
MDGGGHIGTTTVLLVSCCLWCVQGLLVDVTPRRPLFPLGERRRLMCSAHDCHSSTPHVAWTLPGDQPLGGAVRVEGSGAAITFDPVGMEHEGTLQCKVMCGEEIKHVTVRVRVYALPGPPVISVVDTVRWGSEVVLTCRVPDVHPEDHLILTWLRGNEVLQTGPGAGPGSEYHLTLSSEDHRVNVTCRATLVLADLEDMDHRTRETTLTLEPPAPPSRLSLQLLPGLDVLEGDQVTFSCHADGAPPPMLLLRREEVEIQRTGPYPSPSSSSSSSLTFSLSSASLEDSAHYSCEATNQFGSEVVNATVSVRAHPLRLDASPELWAELGSALVLSCRASGCPDLPELTWTRTDWNQNRSILQNSQHPDGRSLLRLPHLDLDQGGGYTCRASCHAVVRERLVQVHVYSFPSDPILSGPVPYPLLIGRESVLRCDVQNVFSFNRVRVRWMGAGKVLLAESFQSSGLVQNLSLVLRHRIDRDQIQEVQEDQKQNRSQVVLTCLAELLSEDGEVWRSRRRRIQLEVQAPPTRPTLQLLPGPDVLEGDQVTFSCYSDGAPPPTLLLRREGAALHMNGSAASLLTFSLFSATLVDSAHYTCEATNLHGSKMSAVTLSVRAPPRNTSVVVLPSNVVQAGQNVTVCCHSVSSPPVTVTLTKLADGTQQHSKDGNFLLVNVSDVDSGLYRVNASNWLGYQVLLFRLRVTAQGPDSSLALLVVPVVCSLAGLLTTMMLLDYMRRSRKKGFYQLAQTTSHSG